MQDPGKIAADTKLDLSVNPGGLMTQALHLWDNFGYSGQLQNQGYGYLWPWGHSSGSVSISGIPAWVCQRSGGPCCYAWPSSESWGWPRCWAWDARGPDHRCGCFRLGPRVKIVDHGCCLQRGMAAGLAPWVLIPLVKGSITGSVRKYAALSGLVFLCVGAVNAVGTVAALPLAAWWLITRQKTARMWRLTGWWVVCIALASLWWLLPWSSSASTRRRSSTGSSQRALRRR